MMYRVNDIFYSLQGEGHNTTVQESEGNIATYEV